MLKKLFILLRLPEYLQFSSSPYGLWGNNKCAKIKSYLFLLISLFISVKVSTIDAFCPSGSDKESVILNCLPVLQKNFPNIDPFKCQKEKYFVRL